MFRDVVKMEPGIDLKLLVETIPEPLLALLRGLPALKPVPPNPLVLRHTWLDRLFAPGI